MSVRSSVLAAAAAIAMLSSPAVAEEGSASDSGLLLSTLGGAVVGGALVYYYSPLSPLTATTLGAIVGGTIGNWWYSASEGSDYAPARPRKQSDSFSPSGKLHLTSYPEGRYPAIRVGE